MRERIVALRRHPNAGMRRIVGATLIICGVLGFLPILGFWMLTLVYWPSLMTFPGFAINVAGWKFRGPGACELCVR